MKLFIGTYISDTEQAIIHIELDNNSFEILNKTHIHSGINPSFLLFHKSKNKIYCVNEMSKDINGDYGYACSINTSNDEATTQTKKISTQGDHPCHVCLSKDEKLLFVTNYTSGSLCIYSIDDEGNIEQLIDMIEYQGSSVHRERQESAHPHESLLSECGKYLFVTDLGCDCIRIYQIDSNRDNAPLTLKTTIEAPKGSGPRHMAFDNNKSILYVCGELSSSILVYSYHNGYLDFLQELKLFPHESAPYPRTSCSEIAFFNGYVYVGNRGDDSITACKQQANGTLELSKHVSTQGKTPRHFTIVDNQNLNIMHPLLIVGNQDSDTLAIFNIADDDLHFQKLIPGIQKPVCIQAY